MRVTILMLFLSAALVSPARSEMRTWTSASGTSVEAEYVRLEGRTVVLKGAEDQMFQIGMIALSDADQAYVQTRQAPAAAAASPATAAKAQDESFRLTEEQIASLKTRDESRRGERLTFTGSFGLRRLDERERRRLRPDSPVAFRITADFTEGRQRPNGQWSRRRLPSRVQFYVLDAEGNVLLNRSEPVASLCPT